MSTEFEPVTIDVTPVTDVAKVHPSAHEMALEAAKTRKNFYTTDVIEIAKTLRETKMLRDMEPEIAQLLIKQTQCDEDIARLRNRLDADRDIDAAQVGAGLAKLYTASAKMAEAQAMLKHRNQTMREEAKTFVESASVKMFSLELKKGVVQLLQSCMTLLKKHVPEESQSEINVWYAKQMTSLEQLLLRAAENMQRQKKK